MFGINEDAYLWKAALKERAKDLEELIEELRNYTAEDIGYIADKFEILKDQMIKDSKIDPDGW